MLRNLLIICALAAPAAAQTPEELAYPDRTDWSTSDSSINLSMYVYNDVNGNGTYDLGDRAMSGVLVGLGRDGAGLSAAHTNANGFANFPAATNPDKAAPINAPGTYLFQAVVPPGWTATGGNAAQMLDITGLPGSISGQSRSRLRLRVSAVASR